MGHEGAAVGGIHLRFAGASFRQGLSTLVRDEECEDQRRRLSHRLAGADCLEIDSAAGRVGRSGRYCGNSRTEGGLSSTHRQNLSQSQHLISKDKLAFKRAPGLKAKLVYRPAL